MSLTLPSPTPQSTLAELATTRAGASRVFFRHGLDFCCQGRVSLADACARHSLDVETLIRELRVEDLAEHDFRRWDERPLAELTRHIVSRYHDGHRAELPRLIAMARKVESVHAEKPSCPRGLADHLARVLEEMESHMQKEEAVLFPMINEGHGRFAAMPIQTMELEHKDHAKNLERTRQLATNFRAPEEACGTWRALYLGLDALERDLMQHMHLENNVLFPRALRS